MGHHRIRGRQHPGLRHPFSVDHGETVHFKVKTDASDYRIDIYRTRVLRRARSTEDCDGHSQRALPQQQPACVSDAATGLVDCGNWAESASLTSPPTAVSGVYIAKLVRDRHGRREPHPLRRPRRRAAIPTSSSRPRTRPGRPTTDTAATASTSARPAGPRLQGELQPAVHDARHSDADVCVLQRRVPDGPLARAQRLRRQLLRRRRHRRRGAELLEHKTFLSVGHDEYWSGGQRANVEAARDAGVNLAFFSGNEVFWKTRWEPSIDGGAPPYTHARLLQGDGTRTPRSIPARSGPGTWRDPRFSPPADGGRPENALTGTLFTVNCLPRRRDQGPGSVRPLRFWRNTSIASLAPGETATLPAGTLGLRVGRGHGQRLQARRADAALLHDVGRRRSTSRTTGASTPPGTATHSLTLYRAPSGALVFGAGTVQWAWGLDDVHDVFREPAASAGRPDAAGDGEPVRRHGRAAVDAPAGTGPGRRRRPTLPRRSRRSPRRRPVRPSPTALR